MKTDDGKKQEWMDRPFIAVPAIALAVGTLVFLLLNAVFGLS